MTDQLPAGSVPLPPGYALVARLGSGGFATVWLAEQGRLGRRVAVKVLGETLDDSERERRFLAECRAIGRLSGHPAVVTVHDAGTTEAGHPYLVMEHLPGGSLHDRLQSDGPRPWAEVLDVGVCVADALAAAHAAGILHRDVKPANVLIDENGAPKLGDFGIARLSEGTNTATGTLVGTIPFTPPEVLSGHRPGPLADVWALGATLHTLLVGTSPFGGDGDEPPAATIARVLRSEAPPLPPAVPSALRDLITATLAPEPADRPPSATEVAHRLQAIQAARGLAVTPARSTRKAIASPPPPGADATVVGFTPLSGDLASPPPPAPPPIGSAPPARSGAAATKPEPFGAPPPGPLGAPPPPGPLAATPPPGPLAASSPTVFETPGPLGAPPLPGPLAAPLLPAPPRPPAPPGLDGPPPPPPKRASRAPLMALAVLVAVAFLGGGLVVLTGDGGDDAGDPTAVRDRSETESADAEPVDDGSSPRASDEVDGIWGTLAVAPSGTTEQPSVAWEDSAADCGGTLLCAATPVEDDVVLAYPGATRDQLVVERVTTADRTETWRQVLDTPASGVALSRAGPVLLLVTTEGDGDAQERVYRGLDPATGDPAWAEPVRFGRAEGSTRATGQGSDEVSVVMLNEGPEGGPAVRAIDNATGEVLWTERGRMLAGDEAAVFASLDSTIEAYDIRTGEPVWEAAAEVQVDDAGADGVTRMGAVLDDVLVTVAGGEVLALGTEDGRDAWDDRQPLAGGTAALGAARGVSTAGGVAVVLAEGGDAGFDPRSGTPVWVEARDPLLEVGQPNVWVGTADRLLVGSLGSSVRLISTVDGSVVESVDVSAVPASLSSYAFAGGVALPSDTTVTAYDMDDLAVLWTATGLPGVRTVVTVEGGVVVLGAGGIHSLQGP